MPSSSRRPSTAARRREREQTIIAATRQLFDERGEADAQIEEIAKAVGINRAILYRHFIGKEELFALTTVDYLDELGAVLTAAIAELDDATPPDRLAALVGAFVDYGVGYPAFVDCGQQLMRRTGDFLLAEISESALFRLGRSITSCLSIVSAVLEEGVASGDFAPTADPDLVANTLYASGLGALQLARLGILVKEEAPGIPTVGKITADQVRAQLVAAALAVASAAD